jgi:hypothetical protein
LLEGDVPGRVVLDLDERQDRFTGTALFIPDEKGVPSTVAFIDTATKTGPWELRSPIFPVDEENRSMMSAADLAARHPGVVHDTDATITLKADNGCLGVSYATAISSAAGRLQRFEPEPMSSFRADATITWDEFKSEVAKLPQDSFVWRGQSQTWRLQTSFHRTGRVDMRRYVYEDIPRLQGALLPHTKTFLDLNSPLLSGGLYNLAQHHGFPTPLLDWTFSPYVAAFFAFRNRPSLANGTETPARIFAFDRSSWPQALGQITHLSYARPHVTIMDLPALENVRALPQQAAAMVTNVQNIEAFIADYEHRNNARYLLAFDLPWGERDRAMRDLRTMGITAGSMFPGLDGTCEDMRHRLFEG